MAADICNNDVFDKMREFKNSEEEKMVKIGLKHVINSDLPFINLVMDSCNGKRCCLFSEACVELKPYVEDVSTGEVGLICMKWLFKLDILEKFVNNGIDSVLNDKDRAIVFLTLLEFLRDRRIHGRAIQEIIKGAPGKTPIIIALAQHLFSQLIPGKIYTVDSTAKKLPEKCPDCSVKIHAGNTSIGSSSTWHGKADILLNQSIAVTVVEECKDTEIGQSSNNTVVESFSDTTDMEPIVKKKKIELGAKTEFCTENVLTSLHTLDQIVAEAVTNGFTQVNMNNSLNDMFIPTIGCTSEQASIFLYDPVNDILLQGGDLLQLWHVTPSETLLSTFSIVFLWLFLNFTTFTVKNLKDQVQMDKSKFHEYMKGKLKFYEEIKTGMTASNVLSLRPVGTLTQDLRMYCTLKKPFI